jgi:YHS domain-containing protein
MRALLILAVLVLVAVVLARLPAAVWRSKLPSSPPRRDELVKDPVCHTYVLMSRAVRGEAGGAPTYFCSRECEARFQRGERPA